MVIFREIARQIGRQIYRVANMQDDILKQVLQTSPSRNVFGRGGIRGIRHGAGGGAIASPFIEQYKSRNGAFQKKPSGYNKEYKTRKGYQQYSRSRSQYGRRYNNRRCRCVQSCRY